MASKAQGGHHIVPLHTYVAVGIALFFLTGLTVAMSFVHLGGWNAVIAFAIAALKTTLVAAVFMHLWFDRKMYFLVFLTAIAFLAIFITFTMFDVLDRGNLYEEVAHPIQPEAAMYEGRTVTPEGHGEGAATEEGAAAGHGAAATDQGQPKGASDSAGTGTSAPPEHEGP